VDATPGAGAGAVDATPGAGADAPAPAATGVPADVPAATATATVPAAVTVTDMDRAKTVGEYADEQATREQAKKDEAAAAAAAAAAAVATDEAAPVATGVPADAPAGAAAAVAAEAEKGANGNLCTSTSPIHHGFTMDTSYLPYNENHFKNIDGLMSNKIAIMYRKTDNSYNTIFDIKLPYIPENKECVTVDKSLQSTVDKIKGLYKIVTTYSLNFLVNMVHLIQMVVGKDKIIEVFANLAKEQTTTNIIHIADTMDIVNVKQHIEHANNIISYLIQFFEKFATEFTAHSNSYVSTGYDNIKHHDNFKTYVQSINNKIKNGTIIAINDQDVVDIIKKTTVFLCFYMYSTKKYVEMINKNVSTADNVFEDAIMSSTGLFNIILQEKQKSKFRLSNGGSADSSKAFPQKSRKTESKRSKRRKLRRGQTAKR
jgi:hypothetical protein